MTSDTDMNWLCERQHWAREQLDAIRRLDQQARCLEDLPRPSFDRFVSDEFQRSPSYGGRSIFGDEGKSRRTALAQKQAIAPWQSDSRFLSERRSREQ